MNLKTLAKELDVSPGTVSRIINNKKNFSVSPEVRKKVLDLVKKSNYHPNPIYQAMRQEKNRQLAIILPNHLHVSGKSNISIGIDNFVSIVLKHGYSFHYLSHTIHTQKTYGLPPWKVAGVLAVDVRHADLVTELDHSNYPYVVLNGDAGSNGTSVQTDDYYNMKLVMEHLYKLGHRRIGYINFFHPQDDSKKQLTIPHYSVRMRLKGYDDFCQSHGLKIMQESHRMDIPLNEVLKIFMAKNVTAVVSYSSFDGLKAEFYLNQMGYRVPADVSIVGFNDSNIMKYSNPPLTVLAIPEQAMGEAAARILLSKCEQEDTLAYDNEFFKGSLILRESTAPCSKIN